MKWVIAVTAAMLAAVAVVVGVVIVGQDRPKLAHHFAPYLVTVWSPKPGPTH
jgi:hypothetical protein